MGSALQDPPPATPASRLRAAVDRLPGRVKLLLGFLLLFGVAFAAAIAPLFTMKGELRAEIAGMESATGVVGQETTVDLGIDNVGDRVISPVCLDASFDGAVSLGVAVFQGLDRVPFRGGRACGGELSGEQTIAVTMTFVPHQAGTLHLRLVAAQGSTEIGPAVHRDVVVSAR